MTAIQPLPVAKDHRGQFINAGDVVRHATRWESKMYRVLEVVDAREKGVHLILGAAPELGPQGARRAAWPRLAANMLRVNPVYVTALTRTQQQREAEK